MSSNLHQRIQAFYDQTSGLWEQVWGEHLHHGYYGPTGREQKDRHQAQVDLIDALLAWAGVSPQAGQPWPRKILDLGCGVGGSSLYLAQKFQAEVVGITLSPVQVQRAQARSQAAGLAERVTFQVADALNLPFNDNTFDWVWSLESGEHLPDKHQFLHECYRVLQPGGRLICATWCHRPTTVTPLTPFEQDHLQEIYRVYCLPGVISLPEYGAIAQQVGFQAIATADWSTAVAPFWPEVIRSALAPSVLWAIIQTGDLAIQGALALRLMSQGYERGLIRFGLLTAKK
jgi:tocopherol O-methyltransferase